MLDIPTAILVDNRNWADLKEALLAEMAASPLTGLDIETNDARRHEGLNKLMKVDDEGFKGGNTKLIFDTNRTDITGFSIYADGEDHAFYVNIGHADIENRLPWSEAKQILDAIPESACHVAHNAPYERTMLRKSLGHNLGSNVICTMQLAVTAFNGDTYSVDDFLKPGLGGITKLVPAINREYYSYNPGDALTNEQEELLFKVIAKESKSDHSYNGFVKSIAYGFGLKGLVQKFLGYKQVTFDEVLNGKPHMGHLTGEEACSYGADDAWCAVKLYHKLLDYLLKNNPAVVPIFFTQENPMTEVYSEVWGHGVNINLDAVKAARDRERKKVADFLRTMKASVKAMLPFPEDGGHEKLVKYDPKKYNVAKYRGDVTRWANLPDDEVDFAQCYQVKTAISKAWAAELGKPESKGMSINYYQVVRCILYDLLHCSFQLSDGKIQSDKEAQAKMRERMIKKALDQKQVSFHPNDKIQKFPIQDLCTDEVFAKFKHSLIIMDSFRALADSDTTMKLFINKYLNLTDPDTGKIYPVLNSLLASRRMALAEPNLSQLPKFGGGAYVRSFFEADQDDHVVLTMDWSSVELVLIGDQSGDPEFAIVFGKRPFGDLHSETAAAILGLEVQVFKKMPDAKQKRTEIGKPANFGYWYSGGLGTVAKELGWSSEQMWEYVEKYRQKYHVGEAWRQSVINETKETGIVTLPDHHQRIRFESTYTWAGYMRQKADPYGEPFKKFMDICIKKIQTRSGNQAVNSRIQGSCATLAKRSVLEMRNEVIPREKFDARIMFLVHDELVFSVHKSQVWRFKNSLHEVMCNHPDIVTSLLLDASCAIGLNYQAWHPENNPKGQIELDELSKLPFMSKERWGQVATQEEVELIVEYLFSAEGDSRFAALDEEAIKVAAAELAAKEKELSVEEADV
jgi:DNA polymerase I-like protein with 3'-5' exonuclease and polymerase domains